MFLEDYNKAIQVMIDTLGPCSCCFYRIICSYDGSAVIFETSVPGVRYIYFIKSGRIEKRNAGNSAFFDAKDSIKVIKEGNKNES